MVTFAMLTAVDPDQFEQAADGYHTVSSAAGEGKDRLVNQIVPKAFPHPESTESEGLAGAGAAAARRRLNRLAQNYHYAQIECGLIRAALNGFAAELRPAKRKLETAVEEARAATFTVGSDGSVTYPAAGDDSAGQTPKGGTVHGYTDETARGIAEQAARFDPNPNAARALDIANRIAAAVREATEIDEHWAPKLRELKAQNDLTVSTKDWADVYGDQHTVQKLAGDYLPESGIPHGRSPEENAAWWAGLDAQEKADYVSLYPASIGALDGLPADIRDEANRAVLAETRGHYQTELAAIPPKPGMYARPGGSEETDWRDRARRIREWEDKYGAEYNRLTGALNGMEAIQTRFDKTGQDGLPEAYLLRFDPEGNGRAIVANGNPDTADHTAVYVPGTGSGLSKAGGDIDRMTALWQESSSMAPGQQVSTVTWIGYDAPQGVVTDATSSHYANDGTPAFNTFMDGLNTTNATDSGGHHTTVGHSYGTTLIGSAARQGDLNADDIVFAGSPGVQVGQASKLDVPAGHVWNEEADGDKVPDLGRWFHGGEQWKVGGGTRIIPSDDLFGAHQMTTDTRGHSGYWDEGSQSLKNQAAVVAGKREKVRLEE